MLDLMGCILKVAAEKSFAPGLPVRGRMKRLPTVRRPRTWVFGEQHHRVKSGLHSDLRLSDGKTAFSWAVRKGIPLPGKKHLAVRQGDHLPSYVRYEGPIKKGYGKGTVSLNRGGGVRIIRSSEGEVRFALLDSKNPQEMFLKKTPRYGKDGWLLINVTPTAKKRPDIPVTKPTFKASKVGELGRYLADRYVLTSKIDGASCTASFNGKTEVFSHNPSVSGELLNHTYILGADKIRPSKSLSGTQVRMEVFGVKNSEHIIHMKDLGGLMNSSPQKALEKMKRENIKLYAAPFKVLRYQGKEMEGAPYGEHLKTIKKIVRKLPGNWIMPDAAFTKAKKRAMINAIKKGRHPLTREGLVAWTKKEHAATPIKIKFKDHKQVYIVDIFPMKRRGKVTELAGGFSYSLRRGGRAVGKVGTGFSMQLRKEMWQNREALKDRKVVIESSERFKSGAYRAPVFISFHL